MNRRMKFLIFLALMCFVDCQTQKLGAEGDSAEQSTMTTQILSFLDKLVAIKVSDIIKFGFSISNIIRQRRRARLQQQLLQAKSISGRAIFDNEVIDAELEDLISILNKGLNELVINSLEKKKNSRTDLN
ncbi:hypothetical protein BpHYR1_010454 [Brachionus plicatilis]|uniref:Uncharacterized protein n=1 Tax=Brachionus plicatilis TaxID=10195 RepID=A0A3M7SLJ2_BRAPC|nr:hypothetical protein BpHYR1_010454 [Brachionus plicatilis]